MSLEKCPKELTGVLYRRQKKVLFTFVCSSQEGLVLFSQTIQGGGRKERTTVHSTRNEEGLFVFVIFFGVTEDNTVSESSVRSNTDGI